ncbi:MAG: LacI family DNA-binding transcriptional regulator [Phycisphaerales bacterium]
MANVRQIAKEAGVSIATVSRVLNNHPSVSDAVRDKVLAAANNQRYVATVGKRETLNVAYIFTGDISVGSPFDAAVMEGVYNGLGDTNLNLVILDARRARRSDETYSQMFQRLGVRGALVRTTSGSRAVCQKIAGQGFPAVVVGDRFDDPDVTSVYCESRTASREAVAHLLALGHRRIAVCINVVEDSDHTERLNGYREAMAEHGLEVDDKLILRIPAYRDGGGQLIRRLATAIDRPTAIYITDPMTAIGAMYESQKLGLRVPDDLSIVGFDDAEMRHMAWPTMTAVCQNAYELGLEACRVLTRIIDGEHAPQATAPVAWLEVHDSTGPVQSNPM